MKPFSGDVPLTKGWSLQSSKIAAPSQPNVNELTKLKALPRKRAPTKMMTSQQMGEDEVYDLPF